jgi:pectate lyase
MKGEIMKRLSNSFCGFVLIVMIALLPSTSAAIPSFPGAEGFGANVTGGRGGRVVTVTNLNDLGPGSFREAVTQMRGPRIIVFAVGGVIETRMVMHFPMGDSNITIAGQTAPGGITISGAEFGSQYATRDITTVKNVIIRHIRVRGVHNDNIGETHGVDAIRFYKATDLMIDHVSASWSCDGIIDITSGARNVTTQWCMFGEACLSQEAGCACSHPEGGHNFGQLFGYGSTDLSIHHNFYGHNSKRNPYMSGGKVDPVMVADIRNLVGYNLFLYIHWCDNIEGNIIGCYFKEGPNSGGDPNGVYIAGSDGTRKAYIHDLHYADNPDCNPKGDPYGGDGCVFFRNVALRYNKYVDLSAPVNTPAVTTHSALEARDMVTAKAGAFPRDSVDRRLVQDMKDGTGDWGKRAAPLETDLMGTPAPTDTDHDGMPDVWETANGLNQNDSSDCSGDHDGDGYTNIEEYINDLAEILINQPTANPTGGVESVYNPDYQYSQAALRKPSAFAAYTGLSVAPNPCRGHSTVEFELPIKSETSLSVYNTLGKKVQAPVRNREIQGKMRVRLNTDTLSPGIYFIKLQTAYHGSALRKLMVVR